MHAMRLAFRYNYKVLGSHRYCTSSFSYAFFACVLDSDADGALTSDAGGALSAPNTIPHTATIPEPPIMYATPRPVHQYSVQKSNGPRARPN